MACVKKFDFATLLGGTQNLPKFTCQYQAGFQFNVTKKSYLIWFLSSSFS